jgi:2-succinyl-5-enolpyruvyl-6-hydroxy-3-cyclohexene-1-carboxylate synthase
MENTLNNLPIYRHDNERGVLISTQEIDQYGNRVIEFIPLTNENIMAKIQSGELKCKLSYDDIHDNNNTYSGERNINSAIVMERIEGKKFIRAWVDESYIRKDRLFTNLYVLTDDTHEWISYRRIMVHQIIETLKDKPEETKWNEKQNKMETQWKEMISFYKGNVDDEQLQFTELIDEALAQITDK